ncbi:uncharacterized protein [Lepeophtheirus salmonis]|uniref:uncharacterized protein isoform X2 n=1 Tax=Lepeophtheirus salmonis TaxID=72036 RepID=UPI001AE4E1FB|nr:protein abrupt-like isoform X2 [Lepeophtheirus salmonis]
MGPLERLCLRWNEYESNFKQGFSDLRQNEELFDVTLISGSKIIKAHKVILCACSPKFRSIIGSAPIQTYPLIYLRGINFYYLELLLSFMYYGEVSVGQDELDDFISIAQEFQIKGLSNYSTPRKRCESQPSTSSNFSTDITQYPSHDSHDSSFVSHDINDFLAKSVPNMEKEECNILEQSNTIEFTENASEQMETNNDSRNISIVRDDINNSLSKSLPNTENVECCVLDESNTLEFTQKTSEQMEGNKEALECISSEQNQVTTKTCGKGRGIDSCSTLILGEATATICSCTDHLCNASNSLPVPRLNLILVCLFFYILNHYIILL